jgi:hypothetical protein
VGWSCACEATIGSVFSAGGLTMRAGLNTSASLLTGGAGAGRLGGEEAPSATGASEGDEVEDVS